MADNPKYPRGQPFRAPQDEPASEIRKQQHTGPGLSQPSAEDLEALETRMRDRLLYISCGAVGILVFALGVGFHFMNQAVNRAELSAAAARADRPATPAAELKTVTTLPLTGGARDRTLYALGDLLGTHLYQSYLNIGFLHDIADEDVYTPAEARNLLITVLSLMDSVDKQLARLPEAALDPDNAKDLARFRQIMVQLRGQARELRALWDTPEADEAGRKERKARFQKIRVEAWEGIKELLDISD